MADLIKLVRTYRLTAGLAERLQIAEEIFGIIQQPLRFFVYNAVRSAVAEDVFQEVSKAVAVSLKNFSGNTEVEFWGWCYAIARNKLKNQFQKQTTDRLRPMPPDELVRLMDTSHHASNLSAQEKHDLQYVMQLLIAAKPECYEFLWQHYVIGLDYADIAEEQGMSYDAVRMKIGRCLETAQELVS